MRSRELNNIIKAWWWAERFNSGNLPSQTPWRSTDEPPKPGGQGSVAFLGVYNKTKLQQRISTEVFKRQEEYQDKDQYGYSVAIFLDKSLKYTNIKVPYATYLMYTLRKKDLNLLHDDEGYQNFTSQLTQLVEEALRKTQGSRIIKQLLQLDKTISDKLGLQLEYERRFGKVEGLWNYRRTPHLLGSFYTDDLDTVLKASNDDPLVSAYLKGTAHQEIDQHWEQLIQAVSINNLPLGKWPSPVEFGSSLMQQFAINNLTGHLSLTDDTQAYIRTVNGPPGTGKTTLLKDVFADLMVQQATQLAALETPANGYDSSQPIQINNYYHSLFKLTHELQGYGIVVTSNNNSAVENISKDFPLVDEIQEHAQKDAPNDFQDQLNKVDFFRDLADKILNADIKKEQTPEKPWGTFAVPMGSYHNIHQVLGLGKELHSYLVQNTTTKQAWQQAVQSFNNQYDYVKNLKKKLIKKIHLEQWMTLSNKQKQLTVPYLINATDDHQNQLNRQLRQARAQLFIQAMNLRKLFICYPVPNRSGRTKFPILEAYTIFAQSNRLDDDAAVVTAFNDLQLLFPVISSTLASFHRMFAKFDEDSLDYVFMDEAGQATPLSAIGALWRAKRFIALGDPAQIKPVVTTDSGFLQFIGRECKVSYRCYLDPNQSVQGLADQANYYGHQEEAGNPWIGMPLWVHRRCLDPMFTISNTISYHGHMAMGTTRSLKDHWSSGWIESTGSAKNKFVVDNAQKLVSHIQQRLNNPSLNKITIDDIYVISPFTAVVRGLHKYLHRNLKVNWRWLHQHVGTVHTFQGKEAKVVYFVVGTDRSSDSAADWSCAQPNLINVAVTRAKKELYVIGDGQRLKHKNYYHEMYNILTQIQPNDTQHQLTTSNDSPKKLVMRYYKLVQAVLGGYQEQVNHLQMELTDQLKNFSGTGFLKLENQSQAAQDYQQKLCERNQKLTNYIESHHYEKELIRKHDRRKNECEELRGLCYWGNLVYLYRKALKKLLTYDERGRHLPHNIYPYGKEIAQHINESKPNYLTSNNKQALNTILGGIKDEQAWKKEMEQFYQDARNTLKGMIGEHLVANVVKAYGSNHVITSINLPFRYRDGRQRDNQIDCVVVNVHGIFILEVKNFQADTITIDKKGYIVTQNEKHTYKNQNIGHQGQWHYNAVLRALKANPALNYHMGYLRKQIHVLYISANPRTKIMKRQPGVKNYYQFLNLDGLQNYISKSNGNLRPDIIQKVVNALVDQQGGERAYKHFCLPDKPDDRANHAWRQYTTMRKLLRLKLDDLVQQRDPDILNELQDVGLQADNGYVVQIQHK